MTAQATIQKQPNKFNEWRLDIPNGTFKILDLKPKRCILCRDKLCSDTAARRKTNLCRKCNNREFAAIGHTIVVERSVSRLVEDVSWYRITMQTIYLDRDGRCQEAQTT